MRNEDSLKKLLKMIWRRNQQRYKIIPEQ